MNKSDADFFDAYKRLDKLCGQVLNCNNGVSEYISQMESSSVDRFEISSWMTDYKSLKHIRWVRNQLAHDDTACQLSDEEDLLFAESFYNRIMNLDDPFSQLRKANQREKLRVSTKENNDLLDFELVDYGTQYKTVNKVKKYNIIRKLLVFCLIGILVLIVIKLGK